MKRSRSMQFVLAVLAATALAGVTASSASAFAWWVGNPSEPKMLGNGEQLPINSGGSVKAPVTFRWLKKFEVKCKGVSYNSLFLEGPVFMGASGIVFEQCEAKKPKHATLVGGKIETSQLTGEIKPAGSNVEFAFEPVGGPAVMSFTLEAPKKRKHKRPELKCTYSVSALGALSGTLGDAEQITTEKTFEFAAKNLVFKQSRVCVPMAKVPPSRRSRGPNQFSAVGLTLKTAAGPVGQGAQLQESSSNLTFATEAGNVECEEGVLAGALQRNESGKDLWTVQAVAATGNFEEAGACKSSFGPVFVSAVRLPWFGEFTSKGANLIRGKSAVAFLFKIGPLECGYQSLSGLKGTDNIGSGPMTVTYNQVPFELAGGFAAQCAPSAQLSGTFAVTSAGEPVEGVTAASEKAEKEEQEEKETEAAEEAEEEAGETVERTKGTTTYSAFSGWGVL